MCHHKGNALILNPLGSSPIFIAFIGFLLKLSHPLKQSKLTSGYRDRGQEIGKKLPAPIANQIAGNLRLLPALA